METNDPQVAYPHYDVTADGKRFLTTTLLENQRVSPLTLVQNWTAELPPSQ